MRLCACESISGCGQMRVLRFAILMCLVAAAAPSAAGDIMITNGSLDMGVSSGPILLEGDRGFRLQGGIAAIGGLFDPLFDCNYLVGRCSPGDIVSLRGSWSDLDAPGVFSIDGVTYGRGSMASTTLSFFGSMVLPPFPSSSQTAIVTAPFVFDGRISWAPQGGLTVREHLVGGGVATMSMVPDPVISGRWKFTDMLYVFGDRLPAPWQSTDVGSTGVNGGAEQLNGSVIVHGAGADIWRDADGFHFVDQSFGADGTISARVVTQQATDQFAKAGVMVRASLDPASAAVTLDVKPDGGIEFLTRYATGESTVYLGGAFATGPVFLRLARTAAGTITSAYSNDGLSWMEIGRVTLSLPPGVLAGLAVTSHDTATLNNALFDHVVVAAAVQARNLLEGGDFEGYEPPSLGPPGWISDDALRQVAAKSETHQPHSGQKNGACWTPQFLDCGIYQEVIAPSTTAYNLEFYASADRPGALVGANVNGFTAASADVDPKPFGDYARYSMRLVASAGDVIRVWMYSPAVPGYVVIDDVSLSEAVVPTIGSGLWTINPISGPFGSVEIMGKGFIVAGTYDRGTVSLLSQCITTTTPCVPGASVDLSSSFFNETPVTFESFARGSITVGNSAYPFLEFGGSIRIDAGSVVLPGDPGSGYPVLATVTAPFTLYGTLKGYEVLGLSEPRKVVELPLAGTGIATAELLGGPTASGGVAYQLYRLRYVFSSDAAK